MQAPVHPPCCDSIPVLENETSRPRLDSITTSMNSTNVHDNSSLLETIDFLEEYFENFRSIRYIYIYFLNTIIVIKFNSFRI